MKKISTILVLCCLIITLQSTIKKVDSSSNPPSGYSGATGDYCNSCHSSYPLNSGGGSVSVNGLPGYTYTPGQTYNFSLTISTSKVSCITCGAGAFFASHAFISK